MKEIRIGVFDQEREYVEMLSSFLREFSRGKWWLTGYTNPDMLGKSISGNKLDFLISTNMEILKNGKKNPDGPILIYLGEEIRDRSKEEDIYCIYRFQNAKTIGGEIKKLILQKNKNAQMGQAFIAIYSPVGRCGKTSLACAITEGGEYGKWLYLGMEDYSSMETYSDTGDFLYFIKERKEETILSMVENSNGKIIVGQGAFETRCFDKEDIDWLRNLFKKSSYTGAVMDIGTGSIKNYTLLFSMDWLFIPYLKDEVSDRKIENFEKVLQLYGYEDIREQMVFLDMEQKDEVWKIIRETLLKGESGWETL